MTFIKLPFVFKIFILSICEWPFNTGLLYVVPGSWLPPGYTHFRFNDPKVILKKCFSFIYVVVFKLITVTEM